MCHYILLYCCIYLYVFMYMYMYISIMQVLLGGGRKYFFPTTEADLENPKKKGKRADGKRLPQVTFICCYYFMYRFEVQTVQLIAIYYLCQSYKVAWKLN